jgi:hypothetical protein
VVIQSLLERLRLHHVGVDRGAMRERSDPHVETFLVDVDQEVQPVAPRHLVAERDHLAELPGRIDVKKWERRHGGKECLQGDVKHHRAVFPDRVEHHRTLALCDDLAHDVDALSLEALQVR